MTLHAELINVKKYFVNKRVCLVGKQNRPLSPYYVDTFVSLLAINTTVARRVSSC